MIQYRECAISIIREAFLEARASGTSTICIDTPTGSVEIQCDRQGTRPSTWYVGGERIAGGVAIIDAVEQALAGERVFTVFAPDTTPVATPSAALTVAAQIETKPPRWPAYAKPAKLPSPSEPVQSTAGGRPQPDEMGLLIDESGWDPTDEQRWKECLSSRAMVLDLLYSGDPRKAYAEAWVSSAELAITSRPWGHRYQTAVDAARTFFAGRFLGRVEAPPPHYIGLV